MHEAEFENNPVSSTRWRAHCAADFGDYFGENVAPAIVG